MFPVVVLDEASQMVEPNSLLPLGRFAASHLIAVGDPKQLPPTVASPPVWTLPENSVSNSTTASLSRSLFERLADAGVDIVRLTTQYRCHPSVADVASSLFYNGTLTSGISPEDRSAILPHTPPITLFDAVSVRSAPVTQINGCVLTLQ